MRWAFSAVVAAFVACTAGSAAHAQASGGSTDCPGIGGAKLATRATFDNGAILTVVERNEGKMRHELVSPDKPKVTVATYYGLFTLMMEVPTWQQEYTYDQDLAQFIPLKVGERIHVNATTKNSLNRATPAITIEMTVMGAESIRIGACDYPVFKIDSRTQLVGYRQRVVIRYYDPASMLTLRNVETIPAAATASPQAIDTRIVKLE